MSGLNLKGQESNTNLQQSSRQTLKSELLFNHKGELDYQTFVSELVTRNHSAEGILFAALFLNDQERNLLFHKFLKLQGYHLGEGSSS